LLLPTSARTWATLRFLVIFLSSSKLLNLDIVAWWKVNKTKTKLFLENLPVFYQSRISPYFKEFDSSPSS
jgi:hypothetical protein